MISCRAKEIRAFIILHSLQSYKPDSKAAFIITMGHVHRFDREVGVLCLLWPLTASVLVACCGLELDLEQAVLLVLGEMLHLMRVSIIDSLQSLESKISAFRHLFARLWQPILSMYEVRYHCFVFFG